MNDGRRLESCAKVWTYLAMWSFICEYYQGFLICPEDFLDFGDESTELRGVMAQKKRLSSNGDLPGNLAIFPATLDRSLIRIGLYF